jgi:hypothetical protein
MSKIKNYIAKGKSTRELNRRVMFTFLIVISFSFQVSMLCQFSTLNYSNNDALAQSSATNSLSESDQLDWTSEYQYPNGETQIFQKNTQNPELPQASSSFSHPLTNDDTNILPLDEILFLGTDADQNDLNGWLFDDNRSGFGELHTWNAEDNSANPDAAAADVDGDSKDEIIFISTDEDGDDFNGWAFDDVTAAEPYKQLKWWDYNDDSSNPTVATGDLDGDGDEEVVFAGTDADDDDLNAWAWNYTGNDFVSIKTWDENDNYQYVDVALGDIDGDGRDEVIFVGTLYVFLGGMDDTVYKIYDDALSGFAPLKNVELNDNYYCPKVAACDYDGDFVEEFVITGNSGFYDYVEGLFVYIIGDKTEDYEIIHSWTVSANQATHESSIACGDIDSDYKDEIMIASWYGNIKVWFYDDMDTAFNLIRCWTASDQVSMWPSLATGDIDCDGEYEVVVSAMDYSDYEDINAYAFDNITDSFKIVHQWDNNDNTYRPVVVCGEFDGDGITIQYTGESWQSQSRPIPIIAMACAPLVRGISQNYILSGTSYGTEISQGGIESEQIAATVSATVSYEGGDPLGAFKASASVRLSAQFSKTVTSTSLVTYGTIQANGYPDDSIVYHIVTYKHYLYTYLTHFDNSMIGKQITLDIPLSTVVHRDLIDHYNRVYFGLNYINPFDHDAGDVRTYPSVSEKAAIIAANDGFQTGLMSVAHGNGFTTASIELEGETLSTKEKQVGFELAAGFSVAGVGFYASFGLSKTNTYGTITGSSVTYSGAIGDIADETDFDTYNYSFGMFVYNYKPNPNLAYQVINYWVENASPVAPPFFIDIGPSGTVGLIISFASLAGLTFLIVKKKWYIKQDRDSTVELNETSNDKPNKDSANDLDEDLMGESNEDSEKKSNDKSKKKLGKKSNKETKEI